MGIKIQQIFTQQSIEIVQPLFYTPNRFEFEDDGGQIGFPVLILSWICWQGIWTIMRRPTPLCKLDLLAWVELTALQHVEWLINPRR